MKTSTAMKEKIKQWEGLRLVAYRCPAGVWTIGYGHTGDVFEGMEIDEEEANEYLDKDLARFEKHVQQYDSTYHWNQNEFDALVSFAFNVGGIHQLTGNGSRTRKVIAEKMLLYVNANGKKLPGLVKRRTEEHRVFLTPWESDIEDVSQLAVEYLELTVEVIRGKHGSGLERKQSIESLGYDYDMVQDIINSLFRFLSR